ncbi:hypothetical protein GQ53DRAFT_635801 [Thozetella sp. PMI_491]|nr:hypothetical protein GQ53DRAFT_635801 [Thozetella sp. PMI_491]
MDPHLGGPVGDVVHAAPDCEPPPAKRPKTLACLRCRRRKQRCDNDRPCANCSRSGEQCVEAPYHAGVPQAFGTPLYVTSETGRRISYLTPRRRPDPPPHMPLAWLGDIASLEERISRLEETSRTTSVSENDRVEVISSVIYAEDSDQRRHVTSLTGTESSLAQSSLAISLLGSFSRSEDDSLSPFGLYDNGLVRHPVPPGDPEGSLDKATEAALFDVYDSKVQCRYPFLRLGELRDVRTRPAAPWSAYFVNMIVSIGLLLLERNSTLPTSQHTHQAFYRVAVTRYLSHVFAQPDRLLHIQAYLLLAMHTIFSPSTERIISIASATMRYCVMAQLHLAEAEPDPIDVATKMQAQMRRRVFWSAYALDRTVGTMFDLPFSIPDYQITVKMYANIDDSELEARCVEAYPEDPPSLPRLTNLSAALHVAYCRQIQSEILNITLHRDFHKHFDRLSHWRLRVLEKLDRWKSLCHRYADARPHNFSSSEWLHMIYYYSLAMLYQPTKATVAGPAGDWTVKSCVQACLIFRKFQRESSITELWLGLIAQFKCGVALLYCFFATPPGLRSPAYELPEASEAVRACSVILSILAERWPQSRCLRDAFDILAREIPLFEPRSSVQGGTSQPRQESAAALLSLLKQLEPIVVHRNTLRMIKEMASEEFVRPFHGESSDGYAMAEPTPEGARHFVDEDARSWGTGMTGDIFRPVTPTFFHLGLPELDPGSSGDATPGFPGEFDLAPSFA